MCGGVDEGVVAMVAVEERAPSVAVPEGDRAALIKLLSTPG